MENLPPGYGLLSMSVLIATTTVNTVSSPPYHTTCRTQVEGAVIVIRYKLHESCTVQSAHTCPQDGCPALDFKACFLNETTMLLYFQTNETAQDITVEHGTTGQGLTTVINLNDTRACKISMEDEDESLISKSGYSKTNESMKEEQNASRNRLFLILSIGFPLVLVLLSLGSRYLHKRNGRKTPSSHCIPSRTQHRDGGDELEFEQNYLPNGQNIG
ncbi:uncharacterized protein LOC108696902 [Xenopus laevis]|uniref:Uncharacterized protein LOC108696902 n=1 Tax=Xenopus laevis TaxID=8355 RepID=A0A8J0TCA6_XENLA|nr:uncharacterized protein LOC108696902 [Xenopus laevis]